MPDGIEAGDGTTTIMTTHSDHSSATGPASHETPQEAFTNLVQQVELAGYCPGLVPDTLRLVTGEEEIPSDMVQSETTFAEAAHCHLTVLILIPNRLITAHAGDTPCDDGSPGALVTSEAVPPSRIRSVALTRGVADPTRGGGTLTEMTIVVSQDSVRYIDMELAIRGDPDCQAGHGIAGVSVPDDVVIHVIAGVEGATALAHAETFAGRLSQMVARAAAL